jgi:hypothetical protein
MFVIEAYARKTDRENHCVINTAVNFTEKFPCVDLSSKSMTGWKKKIVTHE